MKKWLPHLFYIGLLISLGLYLRSSMDRENRLIRFLNRPTDEAYLVTVQFDKTVGNGIEQSTDAYRSPYNLEYNRRAHESVSMIAAALNSSAERDSLPRRMWAFTGYMPALETRLKTIFPKKRPVEINGDYALILSQNDSLRLQTGLNEVLEYLASQVGGLDLRFDTYAPVVSSTTLCPTVGEPVRMDIFLSPFTRSMNVIKISLDGHSLPVEDDMAQIEKVFPDTGTYPLQLAVEYRQWGFDSLASVEKTFFIHVNR